MMTLDNVPSHLRIRILYSDDDVVVIDKPSDLRSVPGHANPPPPEKAGPRSADAAAAEVVVGGNAIPSDSHRRTAQEAWVKAIQLLSVEDKDTNIAGEAEDAVASAELMHNLGTTADPSCVPRKLDTFIKYCHRNSKRLLPSFPNLHFVRGKDLSNNNMDQCCEQPKQKKSKPDGASSSTLRCISHECYVKIQKEQRLLMNLPKPTEDWESAIGQLRILGFGDYSHCVSSISEHTIGTDAKNKKLYVVHRLDCQTSGIMVVARNQEVASFLCRAWRERESVEKVYLAHVRHWTPYHQHGLSEGTIDLALAPSRTERIKWEVTPVEEGGKECQTFWKVFEDFDKDNNIAKGTSHNNSHNTAKGITLELHPLTGRTHQLRIHCAAVGSGIVGDSLYGDSPIAWVGDSLNTKMDDTQNSGAASSAFIASVKTLRLHAHRLSFPTMTGKKMMFASPKRW